MHPDGYFSTDYATARAKFLDACRAAGLAVQSHEHPLSTPVCPLACDVARIGPGDASRLLVLVSGLHGVELFPGSACQTGWLEHSSATLPADTAVLMVHAINPWGAAHLRRNNEDNVDLGRNFRDFSEAVPPSADYAELHALLAPDRRADLMAFAATKGERVFINILMGGQYSHPDGFGYGGAAPSWSNRTLDAILRAERGTARKIVAIEYHSGLGPYGYGMAVSFQADADLERARRWFGRWTLAPNAPANGDVGHGHKATGHSSNAYIRAFPGAEVTPIVVEYGTFPPDESLPVLLDDHRLTIAGLRDGGDGRAIAARNREMHSPDDPDWRQAVWDRSQLVIVQALRGLAE